MERSMNTLIIIHMTLFSYSHNGALKLIISVYENKILICMEYHVLEVHYAYTNRPTISNRVKIIYNRYYYFICPLIIMSSYMYLEESKQTRLE
jgi:hypothetical protein